MNKTWAISSWISFLISAGMPAQLRRSPWRTPISFFRRKRSGSSLKRGPFCRSRLVGNLQSRLAQAVNEMLPIIGFPPFLDIPAYGVGEVRPQFKQSLKGFIGRITFSELPVAGGHRRLHTPVSWQISLEHEIECVAVVALAVGIIEVRIPVPSGMTGIELLGALRQRHPALRVAG